MLFLPVQYFKLRNVHGFKIVCSLWRSKCQGATIDPWAPPGPDICF